MRTCPDRSERAVITAICEAASMSPTDVSDHYGQHGLTERICAQLTSAGVDLNNLDPSALSGVDEFHLGGRAATTAILDSLELTVDSRVLDVGAGIGGAARAIASMAGCSVTGVDLTPEFVATASQLSDKVGLGQLTSFEVANALDVPFNDTEFSVVTMFHVGMNIADKQALITELARVLRPGGMLVVYDIMRVGPGDITFPVPWSSDRSTSFVNSPDDYLDALRHAGFVPEQPIDRLALVRSAMASMATAPPPVNLSHLMGTNWPTMFANLMAALDDGIVSPTQIVARRPE